MKHVNPRDVALALRRRYGWRLVPIPSGEKGPVIQAWQNLDLDEPALDKMFHAPPGQSQHNIGVILGWGGLVDVDLDDPLSLRAADELGLVSTLMWGRPGNPRSHRLYRVPGEFAGRTLYGDPMDRKEGTLVELRGKGHQSICWGIHPSGERYCFDAEGEPQPTTLAGLQQHVARVAACALLAKYYPPSGLRHDALGALIGGLARASWEHAEIEEFVRAVVVVAGDEDQKDRLGWIKHTLDKVNNQKVTGWPTLSQILSEPVVARVKGWLTEQPAELEREVEERGPAASRLMKPSELLKIKFPPLDPLIEGIDSHDLALIVGPPSSLKTMLTLDIACSLAANLPILNHYPAKQCKVMVISEEDSQDITQSRVERWCKGRGVDVSCLDDNLTMCCKEGFYFGSEVEVQAMVKRLDQIKPDLLILDSIHQISGIEDFASASEVRSFFRSKVEPMARRWGCGIILIHHTNKAVYQVIETVRDAGKVAGSMEFVSTPSAVLFVQQFGANPDVRRVKSIKRRRGKAPGDWGFMIKDIPDHPAPNDQWPFRIEYMLPADMDREHAAQNLDRQDDDSVALRVEATLREVGEPILLKRLVELVGRPRSSVNTALLQMEKAGRVLGFRDAGKPTLWSLMPED